MTVCLRCGHSQEMHAGDKDCMCGHCMWFTRESPDMTICPECRAGKHDNCLGDAWDNEKDMPTTCACWRRNHEEES